MALTEIAPNVFADTNAAAFDVPSGEGLTPEQQDQLENLDLLRDRSNHTGTQAVSTVDGLQIALDSKLNASAYINRFKGKFISLSALQTALPTGSDGDYAIVDAGAGANAMQYIWDANEGWGLSVDGVSISTTDQLVEGSSNRYFTETRVRAAVLTGLSLATSTAIVAADSVLAAFGKVQAQLNNKLNTTDTTDAVSEGATNLYFTAARVRATVLTALSTATVAAVTATDSVLSALGKLQAQINYNPITATVGGVKVAAYQSTSGEYYLLQNNLSQHTVRGMSASAGGSTTLASFNLMGANDFAVQGTASSPAKSSANEWLQLPRTKYLNTTLGYLVFVRLTQPMHFIHQTASLQYDAVTSFLFSVSETALYSGARMFCGSKLGSATPTDVSPEQMTDYVGLLQSPFFTANPNRLYFAVNGNGVIGAVFDTGIDVSVGVGYQFTMFQRKNSRIIGFRLKVINTDTVFEQTVDLSTLPASSQPTTGSYYPQLWRSTNGNASGSLVGIDFSRFYNELGN